MSYNREDFIRIKAKYSEKYRRAQQDADARRFELYGEIPEVRELDALLSRTGMDIMEAIGRGGEEGSERRIEEIRRRNAELLLRRGELLRSKGYPADYSDVHYECELCGDTGYVDTKMCTCMRRALIEAGYRSSGIGALIGVQSFENFSLDYYKNSGKEDQIRRLLEKMTAFADSFDDQSYQNFLLMGATGLGKTHLSTSLAKRVIDRGHDVLYVTSIAMLRDFELQQFNRGEGMKHPLDRYMSVELLIVDDLGTEVSGQYNLSWIYDLINTRINNRRCTVLNTNLSASELRSRYGERITSRILGEYSITQFAGTDVRRAKLKSEN